MNDETSKGNAALLEVILGERGYKLEDLVMILKDQGCNVKSQPKGTNVLKRSDKIPDDIIKNIERAIDRYALKNKAGESCL